MPLEPTLGQLGALFGRCSQDRADRSLAALLVRTDGLPDPSAPGHCDALLWWVNQWGCRIRLPRDGEEQAFARSLSAWWSEWHAVLPDAEIAAVSDRDIDRLAEAYEGLARRPATGHVKHGASTWRRSFGPTAAAKILYVLRPGTATPWDAAIARSTVGGTTSEHFRRHLVTARAWARSALDEAAAAGVADIPAYVGRSKSSLAKILDEWHYLTITRREPRPPVFLLRVGVPFPAR